MRVGLVRQDLARIFLDDIENTSQRAFSAAPPGQSRYFEYPSVNVLTSVLNEWAFLSILGSGASFAFTVSGSNNTLTVKTSSTATAVSLTIPSGAYATAAALATALNALFVNNGLTVVASAQGGQIQIDTVAPGNLPPSFAASYTLPSPAIGLSVEYPFVSPINSGPTAYLQLGGNATTGGGAGLGLSTSAITGLSVAALQAGLYVNNAISGQTGAAAAVAAGPSPGTATITGLTGMTISSVLHTITFTGGSHGANDGTFSVIQYLSPTSVVISNAAAVVPDSSLSWTENTVTFNVSYSQIGGLSTFTTMEGYSGSAPTSSFLSLAAAVQNTIAPSLIETGPVLLSFALGKLSKLLNPAFTPGSPQATTETRLGSTTGAAVFITANDGHTAYSL